MSGPHNIRIIRSVVMVVLGLLMISSKTAAAISGLGREPGVFSGLLLAPVTKRRSSRALTTTAEPGTIGSLTFTNLQTAPSGLAQIASFSSFIRMMNNTSNQLGLTLREVVSPLAK
jgi:hypothetical protein